MGGLTFPDSVRLLLWDVVPEELGSEHARFVIERVLELGGVDACNWMFTTFPRTLIIATAKGSRRLSRKSANFWAWYFRLDPQEVQGLQQEEWWRVGAGTGARSAADVRPNAGL